MIHIARFVDTYNAYKMGVYVDRRMGSRINKMPATTKAPTKPGRRKRTFGQKLWDATKGVLGFGKSVVKGGLKVAGRAGGVLGTTIGGLAGSILPGVGTAAGAAAGGALGTTVQGIAQKINDVIGN